MYVTICMRLYLADKFFENRGVWDNMYETIYTTCFIEWLGFLSKVVFKILYCLTTDAYLSSNCDKASAFSLSFLSESGSKLLGNGRLSIKKRGFLVFSNGNCFYSFHALHFKITLLRHQRTCHTFYSWNCITIDCHMF